MMRLTETGAMAAALLAVGSISATAAAGTAMIAADRDTAIYSESTFSNGLGQHFHAGSNSNGDIRRALIYFDVASAVPVGATIDNVTLTLHVSQGHDGFDVFTHRLLADWGEGTSDAPGGEGSGTSPTIGDATWQHTFFNTDSWTTPGGDFAPTASAAATIVGTGYFNWTGPQMIADAQLWLDTPSNNHGWMLRGEEDMLSSAQRFDSRQNPTEAFRPMLMVEYSTVPAPGALTVLGLGLLRCRARRRRSN